MELVHSFRGAVAVTAVSFFLNAAVATAQTAEPRGVRTDTFTFYPALGIRIHQDDNILYEPDNERSSLITVVSPAVEIRAEKGGRMYRVAYEAEVARYRDSSPDDYDDQQLAGEMDLGLGERARINLMIQYIKRHDARGTQRTEGRPLTSPAPDRWHASRLTGKLTLGREEARARLVFEGLLVGKRYDNNREFTIFRDRDKRDLSGTFYLRVAPRTSLVAEAGEVKFDYLVADLDSLEQRYLGGLTWEATAKTTGNVRFGRLEKDLESAARRDFSGSAWEAAVTWRPRTYSVVDLTSSRRTFETNGIGDFIDVRDITVKWRHAWTGRVSTDLRATIGRDDFQDVTGRKDDRKYFSASVIYEMRRWLSLTASYEHTRRDSTSDIFDYRRNVFMITAGIAP